MSRSGPRKSSVSSKQEFQPGKTSEDERREEAQGGKPASSRQRGRPPPLQPGARGPFSFPPGFAVISERHQGVLTVPLPFVRARSPLHVPKTAHRNTETEKQRWWAGSLIHRKYTSDHIGGNGFAPPRPRSASARFATSQDSGCWARPQTTPALRRPLPTPAPAPPVPCSAP